MSIATTIAQVRERAATQWLARTEQERRFLAVGGAVVLLAILYLLLVDPAIEGRARLNRSLPQLRQQAAELQAMAQEANSLARAPAVQVVPLTREAVNASLGGRGLAPQSLSVTGEYIKLQMNNVAFAGLVAWLDEQRRANRVLVQDAAITALPTAGQVDASLTLRQNTGAAQ
ncbi:type II secretion system protein GspM [uncultured Massilia sp.]|uniref:type II secretion system protein GspM n=1 Tax=uncultured Massilia sp. TaxID=169973 RepID=UPI0025FD2028|nr:type II secretion system protein GspM [uncultured Massilia sp.]